MENQGGGQRIPDIALRLGWVSFFNDAASHVLVRILPLYLCVVLGIPAAQVGWIEGLAEGLAVLIKPFSGWLSDRSESRKTYIFGGYGLSFLARCAFLFATAPMVLGASRVVDRIGKGLRCPPRDAMVADATAFGQYGHAFGITSRLDALGAFAGIGAALLVGVGKAPITTAQFLSCVWVAVPLGLCALLVLYFGVPAIPRHVVRPRMSWRVPRETYGFLTLVFSFSLANSSDAFLILKANQLGFGLRDTLLVFLGFNAIAALLAAPMGRLSDRVGRPWVLMAGWALYALAYLSFGLASTRPAFISILLGYGAFYGLTEGVTRALVVDLLPPDQRGMGFGALQISLGVALLIASPVMGWMWTHWGSQTAFLVAGTQAGLSAIGLGIWAAQRKWATASEGLS